MYTTNYISCLKTDNYIYYLVDKYDLNNDDEYYISEIVSILSYVELIKEDKEAYLYKYTIQKDFNWIDNLFKKYPTLYDKTYFNHIHLQQDLYNTKFSLRIIDDETFNEHKGLLFVNTDLLGNTNNLLEQANKHYDNTNTTIINFKYVCTYNSIKVYEVVYTWSYHLKTNH